VREEEGLVERDEEGAFSNIFEIEFCWGLRGEEAVRVLDEDGLDEGEV
jgi:hypothetical protein